MKWSCLAAGLLLAALTTAAHAGDISYSAPLTDDASTGISSAKTYTHAISGGSTSSVNGVAFGVLDAGTTPANFSWTPSGTTAKNTIACCNNGDWNPAAGGVTGPELINLLGSFTYSGTGDGNPASQTFTLSGLTAGTTYDFRTYIRTWDTEASGRPIDLTFTNGAEVDTIPNLMEDRPASVLGGASTEQSAYYVNYRYTAQGSDLVLNTAVVGAAPSGSFHMYGLTNEVVPEPSSAVLASLALLGLIGARRRAK